MTARRRTTVKKNKRNRAKATGNVNRSLVPRGPRSQRSGGMPRIGKFSRPGITAAGIAFLKCAFASPDFSVDPGKGIPDQFHGRTLSIKDCNTTALVFAPGKDTYIIQAPVPGYAYFKAEVNIGEEPSTFAGVAFPTFRTNFGFGTDTDNNFSKFRYASMATGIYPTSNMMQFSGSIQAWRVDLNLAENLKQIIGSATNSQADTSVVTKRIQGLQGVTPLAPRDNFSNNFINGAYTFAFDKSQDFTWQDFCAGEVYAQAVSVSGIGFPTPFGKSLRFDGKQLLTGLGNTNSLVFKVSTPLGAVNTALMRNWNCIELQPDTNSSLFQFSGVSPPHDPIALELYHNLKMQFPVAMSAAENAHFWETVLRAIEHASRIGKLLPGPIGLISGGVNQIATTMQGLFV